MKKEMLYYDFLSAFKETFRRDLLFPEHVVGGQIKIDKMTTPSGDAETSYNFWGYKLEKDGRKYLLSGVDKSTGKEIDLKELLPIKAKDLFKLASGGEVLWQIKKPVPMKITPKQTMSFKQMVDLLSSLDHNNQDHYKLLWFIALTQIYLRANFRISTPPGFGKDSTVDVLGNLIGNCATIETPTLAKLEERSVYLKLMAVNEIIDLAPAEWRTIQQFLLSTGAFKTEITKHSRAYKDTGEVLKVGDLSLSLLYNDIDCYTDYNGYVDFISKKPLLDRFPPLRLFGGITEEFNRMKSIKPESFVRDHYDEYVELTKNILFYKDNVTGFINTTYKNEEAETFLNKVPDRWRINLERLFSVISMYSETQEEYKKWTDEAIRCVQDYREMLQYPVSLYQYMRKLSIPESEREKMSTIEQVISYQRSNKDKNIEYSRAVSSAPTFIEKNILLNEFKSDNGPKQGADSVWN